jgi:hypothetical protein
MPRKAQPRIKRPSGVEQSANGKYFYWKCNISGLETFADEKRFKEVVKSYGSEAKLVKEYVLRPAQKYIDAGFDSDYVKALVKANDGKLPRIDAAEKARKKELKGLKKCGRKPKLKKFAVGENVTQQVTASGSIEEVVQKIYPWTGNPDYFKSPPHSLTVEEATKDTCLYPARQMDDLCYGCPVYDRCTCALKVSAEERNNPKHRREKAKVTLINSFENE